jgi:hypothetical protein
LFGSNFIRSSPSPSKFSLPKEKKNKGAQGCSNWRQRWVLERWYEERRLARKGCFEKEGEKDFGQN